jgi:hypothetical protein
MREITGGLLQTSEHENEIEAEALSAEGDNVSDFVKYFHLLQSAQDPHKLKDELLLNADDEDEDEEEDDEPEVDDFHGDHDDDDAAEAPAAPRRSTRVPKPTQAQRNFFASFADQGERQDDF